MDYTRADSRVKDASRFRPVFFAEILNTLRKLHRVLRGAFRSLFARVFSYFWDSVDAGLPSAENTNELSPKWRLVKVYCIRNSRGNGAADGLAWPGLASHLVRRAPC